MHSYCLFCFYTVVFIIFIIVAREYITKTLNNIFRGFPKRKKNQHFTSFALLRSTKQINFYCWIFFCTGKKVFQENIDYDYIYSRVYIIHAHVAKNLMSTPTSFGFWKTTGSKMKSGNIKVVKPQNKVIKNVPSGQVV